MAGGIWGWATGQDPLAGSAGMRIQAGWGRVSARAEPGSLPFSILLQQTGLPVVIPVLRQKPFFAGRALEALLIPLRRNRAPSEP